MSLLSRFSRPKSDAAPEAIAVTACLHVDLAPRWDSVADMGKKDRASGYICTSCKASFTPSEAEALAIV